MNARRSLVGLILCLAVAARPPVAAAQQGDVGPVYIVQDGDTLTAIALRFGTTVDALAQTNGISDPGSIQPGMRLVLPGYEGVSGVLTFHVVEFGESIGSLAASYRMSPADLARLNRWANPAAVYVGEPAVVPEPETGGPVPGRTAFLSDGEGLLEAAVRLNTSPWLLTEAAGSIWETPGLPIYVPGGESRLSDLPNGLEGVELDPAPVVQGYTTVVHATTSAGADLEGSLASHSLNLMPADSEGEWVALQGIYVLQPPGVVDLEMTVTVDGVARSYRQPVQVVEGGFGRETIQGVPAETLDPANTAPEDQEIAQIVSAATSERMWSSLFEFPTSYHETFPSRFGTRRSYNGSAYIYYHTGLDLYGNPETPILAPAPGRVVFAGALTVRGNATYIDHGWGVYTGYLHQSEILVKPGDLVETGQTIGMVGATGRVTGAHLHWEIWVGGVPVQPLEWTERLMP
ncbi:MAG TPA: peptidoglycan DD-metalloendopeptidase family protein [Anaerolineales bacterium]|nr:peptidoglycan DD-metalloendopeptidase family protein [Anaerolineales bacterium]